MIYALGPILDTDGVFVSPDGEVYRRLPQSNNRAGYRTVTVARRMRYVHELAAQAWLGPRPIGAVVRHLDDVPSNNSRENLAYGTRQDNALDAQRNGRHLGDIERRSGRIRLTPDKVRQSRAWVTYGFSAVEVARWFGVADATMHHAISGRHWGWVE